MLVTIKFFICRCDIQQVGTLRDHQREGYHDQLIPSLDTKVFYLQTKKEVDTIDVDDY